MAQRKKLFLKRKAEKRGDDGPEEAVVYVVHRALNLLEPAVGRELSEGEAQRYVHSTSIEVVVEPWVDKQQR